MSKVTGWPIVIRIAVEIMMNPMIHHRLFLLNMLKQGLQEGYGRK